MYDVSLKRGDTRRAIRALLRDAQDAPVDLTGCRVAFVMAAINGNRPPVIDRAVHIEDAAAGEAWVVWAPGETAIAGLYQAEFKVTYPDGRLETFPHSRHLHVRISDDVRGA